MATVNIIDISKYYGQHLILDQVNLSVEKGEFVAIVGPSGCGKSTLLRLVAGLDEVSSGKILINDQCVNKKPAFRRDIAMVFQSYALYPHMTVYDNMAYGLKMRGMPSHDIQKRVNDVASMLQLSDYLQRKPQALSGGQRQRVAMGRAIVRSPAVFLFDEPLSNLDAKLRSDMRHEIKKLHQQLKTTCLYVTHDQTEAMTMASRILVLNKGRVEQIGTPQTLYQQPASIFVASFMGLYPINFLPVVVDLKQQKLITKLGITFPLPQLSSHITCQDEVILGIRPEHLKLTSRDESQILRVGSPNLSEQLSSEGKRTGSLANTSSNDGKVIAQNEHNTIAVTIEFVDNMGADKLIHAQSLCGKQRFTIKTSADTPIVTKEAVLEFMVNKANIFHKTTRSRIGGWV